MKPSTNKIELAEVLLALNAGGADTPVGALPSDEELVALAEGQLDEVRRAQLLSHIAADENVYERWMDAVELLSLADEPLTGAAATESKPSLLSSLASGFNKLLSPQGFAGLATAAAGIFALTVFIAPPSTEAHIDELYSAHGSHWSTSPSELESVKARRIGTNAQASAAKQAVYMGAQHGLDDLGSEFPSEWLPSINLEPNSVSTLSTANYESLYNSGRLATIAHFKCQLSAAPSFYTAADTALQGISKHLGESTNDISVGLSAELASDHSDSEARVCSFARTVLAELHRR